MKISKRIAAMNLGLALWAFMAVGSVCASPDLVVLTPANNNTEGVVTPLVQNVAVPAIDGISILEHVHTRYQGVDRTRQVRAATLRLDNKSLTARDFEIRVGDIAAGWLVQACLPAAALPCPVLDASGTSAERTFQHRLTAGGHLNFTLTFVPTPDRIFNAGAWSLEVKATDLTPEVPPPVPPVPTVDVVRLDVSIVPAPACADFSLTGSAFTPFFYQYDNSANAPPDWLPRTVLMAWETHVGADADPFSWTNTTASPPISWASDLKLFYADCLLGGRCFGGEDQANLTSGVNLFTVAGAPDPLGAGYQLLKRNPEENNNQRNARKVYTSLDGSSIGDFDVAHCNGLKAELFPGRVFPIDTCTSNAPNSVKSLIKYVRGYYQDPAVFPRVVGRDMDGNADYGNPVADDHAPTEQWKYGDLLRSAPLVIGAPSFAYQDPSYIDLTPPPGNQHIGFAADHRERDLVAYFLTNDGMLHAVRIGFWGLPGAYEPAYYAPIHPTQRTLAAKELWAYVPRGALAGLESGVGPDHGFLADGLLRSIDVKDGNDWKTLLVGYQGRGGEGVFVLDVTDPGNPLVVFDHTKDSLFPAGTAAERTLGNTLAAPALGKLGGEWALVIGSGLRSEELAAGYSSPAWLTIIDLTGADTGNIRKQIRVSDKPGNMLTELKVVRGLDDGEIDRIYFGDYYGALWRVTAARLVALGDGATLDASDMLFQPADYGRAALPAVQPVRPITARPNSASDGEVRWVYFGTGDYGPFSANVRTQAFYGLRDLVGSEVSGNGISGLDQPYVDGGLVDMSSTQGTPGNPAPLNAARASWMVDLGRSDSGDVTLTGLNSVKDANERVLAPPTVFAGVVFFTTFQVEADQCNGGITRMYALDYRRGGLRSNLLRVRDAGNNLLSAVRSVQMGTHGAVPTQPVQLLRSGLAGTTRQAFALVPSADVLGGGVQVGAVVELDAAQLNFGPDLILLWRDGGAW